MSRMNSFRETAPVACEGFGLAAIAGYVNVVALGFYAFRSSADKDPSALTNIRVTVSHMTGAFSRLGLDLSKGEWADMFPVGTIVGGFFLGALLSGAVVGNLRPPTARRCGFLLVGEGFALAVACAFWEHGDWFALAMCAFACGLQNGMTGFYRGVRTTHVTGLITEIATELGVVLRGDTICRRRLMLRLSILSGYFLGGVFGATAFLLLERNGVHPATPLLLPALVCVIAGLAYIHRIGGCAPVGAPRADDSATPKKPAGRGMSA